MAMDEIEFRLCCGNKKRFKKIDHRKYEAI